MAIRQQSRRDFCITVCQTGSVLLFGGVLGQVLDGCTTGSNPVASNGSTLPTIPATVTSNTITIGVGTGSPLASSGSAALVQYSGGSLLVARTAQTTFLAVTAVCTHQGCIITQYNGQTYTCPCHGSQFQTNGQVVHGPATAPLTSYQTQYANDQLVITV